MPSASVPHEHTWAHTRRTTEHEHLDGGEPHAHLSHNLETLGAGEKLIDEDKLTRVVLVDYRKNRDGRVADWDNLVYEQWDVSVELGVQDGGRTLKLWVRNPGDPKWSDQ